MAYLSLGVSLLLANAGVQIWSDLTNAPGEFANSLVTALILSKDVKNPDVDQTTMSETLANWVGYQSLALIVNSVNSSQEIGEPGSGFLRDADLASITGIALGIFGSTITRKGAEILNAIVEYVRKKIPNATPQEALEYVARGGTEEGTNALREQISKFGHSVAAEMATQSES